MVVAQGARRAALEAYVTAIAGELATLDHDGVRAAQDAPTASLFFGSAGAAYAAWRAGRILGDARLAAAAGRLLAGAVGDERDDAFCSAPHGVDATAAAPSSVYFGRAGLAYVAALVSPGSAACERLDAALAGAETASLPLVDGLAGALTAATVAGRATGDPRLLRRADALVERLLGEARFEAGEAAWAGLPHPGIAHGRAGILLALVSWAAGTGDALPGWVDATLEAEISAPLRGGMWCRGAAGVTLLATRAHALTRRPALLDRARRAAAETVRVSNDIPDLCCGAAGGAYALLALDEAAPGEGWLDHAVDLALRSILSDKTSPWAWGLFKGDAGLFCLAVDLVAGGPRPFPAVEA